MSSSCCACFILLQDVQMHDCLLLVLAEEQKLRQKQGLQQLFGHRASSM